MKRYTTFFSLVSLIGLVLILHACSKDTQPNVHATLPQLPSEPYQYGQEFFPQNSIFNHRATLGRVLFYDRQLSANNSVSCGSCHKQAFSFADNVALSRGLNNELTERNSMPVINLASSNFTNINFGEGDFSNDVLPIGSFGGGGFFWDGREINLERLSMMPVKNHIEMGISDAQILVDKIQRLSYYPQLFRNAYGTEEINVSKIATAMAAFMSSIQSNKSKNDQFFNSGNQAVFNAIEQRGFELFFTTYNCGSCHEVSPGSYNSSRFFNIGLDAYSEDPGLAGVLNVEGLRGVFRTPNLKNVELTAPYMHDGRFATLDEVLEHYSSGIKDNPGLPPQLKTPEGQAMKMHIPQADKDALIAYLKTFTDYTVITDPKFSDPFKIVE
jgi:cytochrome c peroxidase